MEKRINTPLRGEEIEKLEAGDFVRISGVLYTARDAAHRRMVQALERGEGLPFEPGGAVIYYVGPCPGDGKRVIGSCGPTTSGRLDTFTPALLEQGIKGMIGKGQRSPEVVEAIRRHRAVYFAAVGGAGAYLAQKVRQAGIIAYPDLGPEAVMRLEVEDFPCIVAVDSRGRSLYELQI